MNPNNKLGTSPRTYARAADQAQYPKHRNGMTFNPQNPREWITAAVVSDRKPFDYALVQYQFMRYQHAKGRIPKANIDCYERTILHFYNRLERDVRQML